MVCEYGERLADEPDYAEKAARIAASVRDPVELLEAELLERLGVRSPSVSVAFYSPCTLQRGAGLGGRVEALLRRLGFTLAPVAEGHLGCGSAGTYALL